MPKLKSKFTGLHEDHGEELITEIAHIVQDNDQVSKIVKILNRENQYTNTIYGSLLTEYVKSNHKIVNHVCDLRYLNVAEIYRVEEDEEDARIEFALQIQENQEIDFVLYTQIDKENKNEYSYWFEELKE